ncbi:DoxX family protein [Mucilaginibacter limnophilus]|uniref:DoxX family protein n=1 Tax=Mucilaginibacter limnophilus TaxID=1932778 RepID=A0A437MUQ4_9SPHI|nr:DoxX family protein [Mucilaginibacter limnophilus]RVU01382.1 DoxX family protein [Mucilaginibacter limnophilus]
MALFSSLGKYKNFGLLLTRLGLGVMFIWHGYPKLMGGPQMWEQLGMSMQNFGINFLPTMWGFLSAITESFGGLLILIGFAFRPACIFLTINLIVAAVMHLSKGDGVMGASHAIEVAFVFAGLLFVGPGRYSVDKK